MDAYAKKTGGQVLAIPHNGNLTQRNHVQRGDLRRQAHGPGLRRGSPPPRAAHGGDADQGRMARPHPYLSSTDEFADFERSRTSSSTSSRASRKTCSSSTTRARRSGWACSWRTSSEPTLTQFGMIGGNDAHVGVVTTRRGQLLRRSSATACRPRSAGRLRSPWRPTASRRCRSWNEQAAGLGGVWARENTLARDLATRSSRKDGLLRPRATGRPSVCSRAGTSCPRTVTALTSRANGYAHGVPMRRQSQQGAGRQATGFHGLRVARSGRTHHAPSLIKAGSSECEWKRGEPALSSDRSCLIGPSPSMPRARPP